MRCVHEDGEARHDPVHRGRGSLHPLDECRRFGVELPGEARGDAAGVHQDVPGPSVRILGGEGEPEEVGFRLIQCYCDEQSWALRRLLYAELSHLPDLLEIVQVRASARVQWALADRLARLALAGRLRVTDPDAAVEQLSALLTGPLEARAAWGTRRLSAAEMRQVAAAAIDTFLHAFGPRA